MSEQFPISILAAAEDAGKRLDQFLVTHLPETSRARVQQLIEQKKVLVNEAAGKPSLRLRGGERIAVLGAIQAIPLRAIAEEIPLDIVFEDDDLAIVNKPAGMMVHAGAGATDDERNRGTPFLSWERSRSFPPSRSGSAPTSAGWPSPLTAARLL